MGAEIRASISWPARCRARKMRGPYSTSCESSDHLFDSRVQPGVTNGELTFVGEASATWPSSQCGGGLQREALDRSGDDAISRDRERTRHEDFITRRQSLVLVLR